MRPKQILTFSLLACVIGISARQSEIKRDYPIQPVPFTAVHVTDEFWAPRISVNRNVSIPTAFDQCERTGRVENFVRAALVLKGGNVTDKHAPPFPFDDTDPYKVLEGASYALSVRPDPKLDAYLDSLIEKIAAAQEKDGYLYTTRTIDPQNPHEWAGKERWVREEVLSHELYNLGHLYEAAVAHYQATGKKSLLNVALKSADLLVATFGPGKRKIYPGHQIAEMGLVKLYRVTGKQEYLDLAKFLLDSRGPGGDSYNQAHRLVVDQTEAEGHAVRATYMYSGIADVAALTGDKAYLNAIDQIWQNVVAKKIYITGGIGALGRGEAFGGDYELPNMTAYNETCAAVGNDFWNQRLFLLHGDAKYIDVFERTLYNGLISGVSLDGKTYFYPNPLESNGQHQRSPWFGVACCPGNITRFMPSVPGYVYAQQGDTLYVNLFMSNNAEVTLGSGKKLKVTQSTRYPWDGNVKIGVNPEKTGTFTLNVRIPGWAHGEPIPSDLYHFSDENNEPPHINVNGADAPITMKNGYATLTREWRAGDTVELALAMPIRRIKASPKVEADQERVALQKGPLVYCLEGVDNAGKRVRNLLLKEDERLTSEFKPQLLNGIEVIQGRAVAYRYTADNKLRKSEERFTAIPYYAWENRGPGQMEVWIATSEKAVHPMAFPSIASTSKVNSSGPVMNENGVRDPRVVADQEEPTSSSDSSSFYDFRPKQGTQEWLQYDFEKAAKVSQAELYWFEDSEGHIRVPANWRLMYLDGKEWRSVETQGSFGVAKDKYNAVTFKPVTTKALRLEMTLQPEHTAGVIEWKVR